MKVGPTMGGKRAAQMLLAAIDELQEQNNFEGTTADAIVDHIKREFRPTKTIQHHLPEVIERGIAFGVVEKKNGRLYLAEMMDHMRDNRRRKRGGSRGGRKRRKR